MESSGVVTTNEKHTRRMDIDYILTINRLTSLDAYPKPRVDEQMEGTSNYFVVLVKQEIKKATTFTIRL